MKYTLSLLYIVLAFFVSAQEKPKNNPAIKRFVYQSNSQISKRVYDSIYFDVTYTKGKKWVFHFSQQSEENPMVSDDEYQESYTFEIDPPKGNRFTIADGEFVKHQVVYSGRAILSRTPLYINTAVKASWQIANLFLRSLSLC